MANPIKSQDLIDLEGYRREVVESKAEYKAFADDVVRLNDIMKTSAAALRAEVSLIQKANGVSDDGKNQEQYAQRLAQLRQQLESQKAATTALAVAEAQLEKVTGSLIQRQEQLLTEYANLNGTSAKVVSAKRRIANELVNLQNQFEKLDKPVRQAAANAREVTGQYNLLQKELSEARKALKSLDDAFDANTGKINQNNKAAAALAEKIRIGDAALKRMDATMGVHNRNVGNYQSALQGLATNGLTGLIGSFGLLGLALTKVIDLGGQAIDKMTQFEQIRGGLKGVTDDSTDLVHTQEQLEAIADKLGVSYGVLANSYKGIKVGTKDTALEGREAERIFGAFVNRLAEVKAPAEKAERALLALEQMISKGTIQAEELRGQLGDAMPGAFKLFADAAGVSTQQLNKMLKNGEVLAVDILPKVADQLERTFSGTALENVESLTGATARLDNQTGLLLDTFNQTTGITAFYAKIKNGIADTLAGMRLALKNKDWIGFFSELNATFAPGVILKRAIFGNSNPALDADKQLQAFKSMSAKMRQARIDLLKDQASNLKNKADFLSSNPAERAQALTEYKKASDELRLLQVTNLKLLAADRKQAQIDEQTDNKKYHQSRIDQVTAEAKELTLAQRQARIVALKNEVASKEATLKADPNNANKTTFARDIIYAKEFITAIQSVNKELEKKDKKDAERNSKAAAREAKQAADKARRDAEARLQNSLGLASADTGTQLEGLSSKREQGLVDEQQYIIARYNITVSGIQKRQALLVAAGKQETDDYARTQKDLAKADAEYQKGRSDLQEKGFRKALATTRDAINADEKAIELGVTRRLGALESAYEQEEGRIRIAIASRTMSEADGEDRIHDLRIKYLGDVQAVLLQAQADEKTLIEARIETLRASGKSEVQIAEIVALEKEELEKAERLRKEGIARADVDRTKETENKKLDAVRRSAEQRQQIEQKLFDIAGEAIQGYFDLSSAFRQADIDGLSKQKDYELSLIGDNAEAKSAIEAKYAAKERELKRKQAIADKLSAIFAIQLRTAMGIAGAISNPITLPLIPFIVALGAIQLGFALAKPIPEFYKGTSDAPEGAAWVGERGYELIESKQNGKPTYRMAAEKQLTYLNAHDRVMTHEESKRFLRVNTELAQEVRSAPGGSQYAPPVIVQPTGITKADLMDAFGAQTIEQTVLSDGELKKYIIEKQKRTEWKNKYFSLPRKGR